MVSRASFVATAWSQPATGKTDMASMAYITGYEAGDDVVVIEGEASGSYRAYRDRKTGMSRPGLDRFRRMFVWAEGRYVLVIDDVRAREPVEITWLMQAPRLIADDVRGHRYTMSCEGATIGFQVASSAQVRGAIIEGTADNRGRSLGWQQLQLTGRGDSLRFFSVYDVWGKGGVVLSGWGEGAEAATIRIQGSGIDDGWSWQAGPDNQSAGTIVRR